MGAHSLPHGVSTIADRRRRGDGSRHRIGGELWRRKTLTLIGAASWIAHNSFERMLLAWTITTLTRSIQVWELAMKFYPLTSIALLFVGATAWTQTPDTRPTDPSTAASPHQKSVTGQSDQGGPPSSDGSTPNAASSPHQRAVTGETSAQMGTIQHFVLSAAIGGMTEVELSKLALRKSANSKTKSFAQMMVNDHSKANSELKSIATLKAIDLPSSLDNEHAAAVESLAAQTGAAFDQAYARQMVSDHQKTVALFKREASDNNDAELAAFAKKTLPTIETHLQMAMQL
jgi:putative membrane protein